MLSGRTSSYLLDMDGMDYQILVEADFLVNLFENASTRKVIRSVDTKISEPLPDGAFCMRCLRWMERKIRRKAGLLKDWQVVIGT